MSKSGGEGGHEEHLLVQSGRQFTYLDLFKRMHGGGEGRGGFFFSFLFPRLLFLHSANLMKKTSKRANVQTYVTSMQKM